jgi:segregation and condensation protein B
MDSPNASDPNKLAALEALLFIHGEPLPLGKIAAVLDVPESALPQLFEEFKRSLADEARGLAFIADKRTVQLVTKPALSPVIQDFVKREMTEDLTPASLEAMSLIAYLGPLPRSRLDYLRGVNSSFILRSLMMRGLVERYPDPDQPSAMLYRATIDLWKHLGVEDQAHLPEYEKFKNILEIPLEPEAAPAASSESTAPAESATPAEPSEPVQ